MGFAVQRCLLQAVLAVPLRALRGFQGSFKGFGAFYGVPLKVETYIISQLSSLGFKSLVEGGD